jgi:heparin binding hemagglutinin HbhA
MTFTTTIEQTIEKTRKDLEKTLSDPTPLYVIAGAGDFAVEKLRAASAEFNAYAAKFDPKAFREQAQATVSHRVESLQSDVQSAPDQVKELPSKLQAALGEAVATALSGAVAAYGDFAERGEVLVTRIRKQQAAHDLDEQLDVTAAEVKAATTTVKKSVKTTKSSAKATATTAKKSAAKTRTAAKAAGTSAKKSAEAATKAVSDSAEKIGD